MQQTAGGDVSVSTPIGAQLCVVLAPVARIHRHHRGHLPGTGADAVQHGFQVLYIRRMVARPHRHVHLVVAVYRHLAVVALQVGAAGLHEMVVGISAIALGLPGWGAIGPSGQTAPRHRLSWQRLQVRRSQAGILGSLNRRLPGGSGLSAAVSSILLSPACSAVGTSDLRVAAALALTASDSSCRCRAVAAAGS